MALLGVAVNPSTQVVGNGPARRCRTGGNRKDAIVVANDGSNEVSVLLGNGNGTFQAQRSFTTGNDPNSVAIGDVTGDGKPDIVVTNYGSDTVSVLLGNGNGTFQTQHTFAAGYGPSSVAVADMTGDGKLDLVVENKQSNTVSILLNAIKGNLIGQIYGITTGAATTLTISGLPSATTAGNSLPFTLTALNSSNNVATGYTGTVHFSTTDAGPGAVLPADFTFVPADGGVHVFTSGAILVSPGIQTLTAFDTPVTALSVSASVSVTPAAATHFAIIGYAIL